MKEKSDNSNQGNRENRLEGGTIDGEIIEKKDFCLLREPAGGQSDERSIEAVRRELNIGHSVELETKNIEVKNDRSKEGIQSLQSVDRSDFDNVPNVRTRLVAALNRKREQIEKIKTIDYVVFHNYFLKRKIDNMKVRLKEQIANARSFLGGHGKDVANSEDFEPLTEEENDFVELVNSFPVQDNELKELLLLLKGYKREATLAVEDKYVDLIENLRPSLRKFGLDVSYSQDPRLGGALLCDVFDTKHKEAEREVLPDKCSIINTNLGFSEEEVSAINSLIVRVEGIRFGFPKTAIDAYVSDTYGESKNSPAKKCRDLNDQSVDTREDKVAYRIANFRFSKDHFKDEFDLARAWALEIKRLDPFLYKRLA